MAAMKFNRLFSLLRQPQVRPLSQDIRTLNELPRFRKLAESAWDDTTIYPKNEYRPGNSAGQCGVTNFGFGMWLDWLGIVSSQRMFYEEGGLNTANGSLVGENHTWLRVIVDDGYAHRDLSLRFDLAGDQFDGIESPTITQLDDYFYPDPKTAQGNRVYNPNAATRLCDYPVSRFNGRLGKFMVNICKLSKPEGARLRADELLIRWNLYPDFEMATQALAQAH